MSKNAEIRQNTRKQAAYSRLIDNINELNNSGATCKCFLLSQGEWEWCERNYNNLADHTDYLERAKDCQRDADKHSVEYMMLFRDCLLMCKEGWNRDGDRIFKSATHRTQHDYMLGELYGGEVIYLVPEDIISTAIFPMVAFYCGSDSKLIGQMTGEGAVRDLCLEIEDEQVGSLGMVKFVCMNTGHKWLCVYAGSGLNSVTKMDIEKNIVGDVFRSIQSGSGRRFHEELKATGDLVKNKQWNKDYGVINKLGRSSTLPTANKVRLYRYVNSLQYFLVCDIEELLHDYTDDMLTVEYDSSLDFVNITTKDSDALKRAWQAVEGNLTYTFVPSVEELNHLSGSIAEKFSKVFHAYCLDTKACVGAELIKTRSRRGNLLRYVCMQDKLIDIKGPLPRQTCLLDLTNDDSNIGINGILAQKDSCIGINCILIQKDSWLGDCVCNDVLMIYDNAAGRVYAFLADGWVQDDRYYIAYIIGNSVTLRRRISADFMLQVESAETFRINYLRNYALAGNTVWDILHLFSGYCIPVREEIDTDCRLSGCSENVEVLGKAGYTDTEADRIYCIITDKDKRVRSGVTNHVSGLCIGGVKSFATLPEGYSFSSFKKDA